MGGSAAHKVKVPLSLCPKLAASNTRCEDRNRDKKTEGQTDKQTGVLKIQVACQLRIASYMNGLTDTKTQIMIDPVSPQFSCHKIHFVFNSHSRAAASCQPTCKCQPDGVSGFVYSASACLPTTSRKCKVFQLRVELNGDRQIKRDYLFLK